MLLRANYYAPVALKMCKAGQLISVQAFCAFVEIVVNPVLLINRPMSKYPEHINRTRHPEDLQALAAIRRAELHLADMVESERNRSPRFPRFVEPIRPKKHRRALLVSLRSAVYARDRGCCAMCSQKTDHLAEALFYVSRQCEGVWRFSFASFRIAVGRAASHWPRLMWEADHRIPVSLGGSNDLSNVRTLCLKCHGIETKRLRDKTRVYEPTPDWTLDHQGGGNNR